MKWSYKNAALIILVSFIAVISVYASIDFHQSNLLPITPGYHATGFRVKKWTGEMTRMNLRTQYWDCKRATNISWQRDYFIPTKTNSGWTSFKSHVPVPVNLSDCIAWEYITTIWLPRRDMASFDGEFAFFWWYWFTVDGSWSYYVSNHKLWRIDKYSSTGKYLLSIGWENSSMQVPGSYQRYYAEFISPTDIPRTWFYDTELSGTGAGFNLGSVADTDEFGNIYVVDSFNQKIKKYSSTGTYMLTIGSIPGDNNLSGTSAQLFEICGAQYDSGILYVVDQWCRKLKKYSSTGQWIGTVGNNYWDNNLSGTSARFYLNQSLNRYQFLYTPTDSYWRLTVASRNGKLKRYLSDGTFLFDLGTGFPSLTANHKDWSGATFWSAWAFYINNPGNIIVTKYYSFSGASQFDIYNGSWNYITTIGSGVPWDNNLSGTSAQLSVGFNLTQDYSEIELVKIDDNWYIYVLNNLKIKKYSSWGTWITDYDLWGVWWYYGFIGPASVSIDSSGSLYLLGSQGFAKYSSSWALQYAINDSTLAHIDASNNVYYHSGGTIHKLSSTGQLILVLWNGNPTSDNTLSWPLAWLMWPDQVSVDNSGNIYVWQTCFDASAVCKIRKYTSTGVYLLSIGGIWGDNNLSWLSARNTNTDFVLDFSGNILVTMKCPNWDCGSDLFKVKKYTNTWVWISTLGSIAWDNNLSWPSAQITVGTMNNYLSTYLLANNKIATTGLSTIWWWVSNQKIKIYSSTGGWITDLGGMPDYSLSWSWTNLDGWIFDVYSWTILFWWRKSSLTVISSTGYANFIGNPLNFGDNNLSWSAALLGEIQSAIFDNSWKIWISTTQPINTSLNVDKIKKYSSTWMYLSTIGDGIRWDNNLSTTLAEVNIPMYLGVDNSWNLLVHDSANAKIKKYSSNGVYISEFPVPPYFSERYMFHKNGNVYIEGWDFWWWEWHTIIGTYTATGYRLSDIGSMYLSDSNHLSWTSAQFSANKAFVARGNIWLGYNKNELDNLGASMGYAVSEQVDQYSVTGQYIRTYSWNSIYVDKQWNTYLSNLTADTVEKYDINWVLRLSLDMSNTPYTPIVRWVSNSWDIVVSFTDTSILNMTVWFRIYDIVGSMLTDTAITIFDWYFQIQWSSLYFSDFTDPFSPVFYGYSFTGQNILTLGNGVSSSYNMLSWNNAGFWYYPSFSVDNSGSVIVTANIELFTWAVTKYSSTGAWMFSYLPWLIASWSEYIDAKVDSSNNIYVTQHFYDLNWDGSDYSLIKLTSTWLYNGSINLWSWWTNPRDSIIDRNNNIVVLNNTGSLITIYSSTGVMLSEIWENAGLAKDNNLSWNSSRLRFSDSIMLDEYWYLYILKQDSQGYAWDETTISEIKVYFP